MGVMVFFGCEWLHVKVFFVLGLVFDVKARRRVNKVYLRTWMLLN